MFYAFIISKILLTIAAFYLILGGSPWILLVFIIFIALDLLDSKMMAMDYRPYDSFFDRAFAYLCFLAFFLSTTAVYPAIVYIAAFSVRDFFVLSEIQSQKNYSVKSNYLDRTTMLVTAIFFALQAGGWAPAAGVGASIFCYLIAVLILYQGMSKIRRIRETAGKKT